MRESEEIGLSSSSFRFLSLKMYIRVYLKQLRKMGVNDSEIRYIVASRIKRYAILNGLSEDDRERLYAIAKKVCRSVVTND